MRPAADRERPAEIGRVVDELTESIDLAIGLIVRREDSRPVQAQRGNEPSLKGSGLVNKRSSQVIVEHANPLWILLRLVRRSCAERLSSP